MDRAGGWPGCRHLEYAVCGAPDPPKKIPSLLKQTLVFHSLLWISVGLKIQFAKTRKKEKKTTPTKHILKRS
jgi:hypothetical protein